MNKITINGKTVISGRNISIINGKCLIDGKAVELSDEKTINFVISGNVESLEVGSCEEISITGDVGNVRSASGNIKCGNAKMVESVSGDIRANDVFGNVTTVNGDVSCRNVSGSVSTMSGDIN